MNIVPFQPFFRPFIAQMYRICYERSFTMSRFRRVTAEEEFEEHMIILPDAMKIFGSSAPYGVMLRPRIRRQWRVKQIK